MAYFDRESIMETADEFLNWLGEEFSKLIQTSAETGQRFRYAQTIVASVIDHMEEMWPEEQEKVFNMLNVSHLSQIGSFVIPYDIRDDYDIIEEVMATIDGILEDYVKYRPRDQAI